MSIVSSLSLVRRKCTALNKYCLHVTYVEKLLKRFLLLLTNYCLIEDAGISLSYSAECTLLLSYDKLRNKAV
jgi:hypothetical protein